MKELYLVRHAQSQVNANAKVIGGQNPQIPLSKEGERQSKQLGKKLRKLKFNKIISSTAIRAKRTAELALPKTKYETSPEILEVSMGSWEGKSRALLKTKKAKELYYTDKLHKLHGGESLKEAQKRVVNYLDTLPDGKYLIFSHSMSIRLFLCYILNIPIKSVFSMEIPNSGMIRAYQKKRGRKLVWKVDFGHVEEPSA